MYQLLFFSSHPSKNKETKRYISIEGIKVPNFLFDQKKDFTYMRIDEKVCLNKFLIRDYIGNLSHNDEAKEFWDLICSEVANVSMVAGVELDGLCDCNCLKDNGIEPMYCIQEIHNLSPDLIEEFKEYGCVTSCPCCWKIIDKTGSLTKCPHCGDNLVAYVHDFWKMVTEMWEVEE
ncbi:MAG: hypothetical protein IPL55_07395 [Saprospiraceae bacterium]|nr:hypothetical protein [Saprospiraceae bacterium]